MKWTRVVLIILVLLGLVVSQQVQEKAPRQRPGLAGAGAIAIGAALLLLGARRT